MDVLALEHGLTLAVDDLALLVHHVVVLEHVLADLVVAGFDRLLCIAHTLGDALGADGLTFGQALGGHHSGHQLGVEQAHQVILQAQVEPGLTGVALTAGTAAQLVVDAAGLVPFGAQHVEAAQLDNLLMLILDLFLDGIQHLGPALLILLRGVVGRVALLLELLIGEELHVAAQHDVGAAPGHVGGHGHGPLAPCHGYDSSLARMLLGVEHLVVDAGHVQQGGDHLGGLHGCSAQQDGLALGMPLGYVPDDGGQLLLLGAVDQIVLILADHGLVGGDGQHAQLVGVHELGGLGLGRSGHARQLVVHAEVVLQGDGGEGLVLGLDLHALLGLDGLVEALVVAAALEQTAGVLVHDQNLAVLDHVVTVAQEELLGLDGVVQVPDQGGIGGLVKVVDAQVVLDLGDAGIQDADDLLLLVDLVVLVPGELGDQLGELPVPSGHIALGGSGDDQRSSCLVDQDGIHLVHDGEMVAALDQLVLVPGHVVAQVVEAEFIVGAVGDVRLVLLAALVGALVGDDAAHAHAQEAEDAPHELALVGGQVVVDRDHVHALALQGIQIAGQGGHQGLALAGLHLRDVAPVQCRAAHQLDIEMPLAQGALGNLTNRGEGFRHQGIEGFAVLQSLLELGRLRLELLIAHGRDLILEGVGRLGHPLKLANLTTLAHTEDLVQDCYHVALPTVLLWPSHALS